MSQKRPKSQEFITNEDDSDIPIKSPKQLKLESKDSLQEKKALKSSINAENETYWPLTGTKRLTISTFKGKKLIQIREYYEKDGEMRPGKKGIALNMDDFDTFCSLIPQIKSAL